MSALVFALTMIKIREGHRIRLVQSTEMFEIFITAAIAFQNGILWYFLRKM